MRHAVLPAVLGTVFAVSAAAAVPAEPVGLRVTLTPRPTPAGVAQVDVALRFSGLAASPAETPLLALPLVSSNVDTVATTLAALEASDAQGPLMLRSTDAVLPTEAARDAETGGMSRLWRASRPVAGDLVVHFTVPANATLPPRGAAPPFGFSDDGAAFSAAGHVFLPLPVTRTSYRMTVAWDLTHLPKRARGISSFGEGTVSAPEPLSASSVRSTFFMAGAIGAVPTPLPASGFFGAWQGKPAFDAAALLRWTGTLYGHYASFFGQRTPPPYGVFLRYNPINAGGGVGLYHAFVATFGKGDGSNVAKLRITLAHEMFHTFSPFISQPAGLESSWFGEGLAVFYARRLALRFGQISPDAFLDDLNSGAARYYTSLMATVPNSEVPKRFWADTRIRTLPYDRGMLYFATVDDAVRKASAGKRSLDDLMLAMLALEKSGKTTSNADWETMLQTELGANAVEDFHAFIGGRQPLPASDAFGPCFVRTMRPLRRYELGFDTAVLAEPRRIVRGLVAGSAAALAGVRDGDEIVAPVPQDGLQGNQTELIELKLRRDGVERTIRYLPRGETVQAWQWQRRATKPTTSCIL
jgi:hypothetical protein